MTLKNMKKLMVLGSAMMMSTSAMAAFDVTFDDSVSFLAGNLDPIIGTGISNANFVRGVFTDAMDPTNNFEMGLKAHGRFTGDLPNTGSTYFAETGTSVSTGGLVGSKWNYTFVMDLGVKTIADYQIDIMVDFDPAAGVESFVNIDITAFALANGFGGLSFLGSSENLDFDFWALFGAPPFDPNATGEYEIKLSVHALTGEPLGVVSNTVVVVTLPSAALAGLGMLGGLGAYRRIRR